MNTTSNIKPRRRLLNLAMLVALGGGLVPTAASAADWVCGSNWWDVNGCWTGGNPLANGGNAYLMQSDATNRVVSFRNTAFPSAKLGYMVIDATGTGTMTFSQSQDTLAVTVNTIVGYNNGGTGTFNQSGGTANVGGNALYLAYSPGSSGTYNLSAGTLTAGGDFIGYAGTGTFSQSGGTNTVYSLYLGNTQLSSGTYNLSAGTLTANGYEYISDSGAGTFNQSGGTNTTQTIYMGLSANGTYNQSAGTLNANSIYLGGNVVYPITGLALGTFNLSGGIVNVFSISGGLGSIFNLDGGTLNLTHSNLASSVTLQNFNIGHAAASNGSFTLGSNKTLAVANESIGDLGAGTLTQSGGTHTVTNSLIVGKNFGSTGTINQIAGSLSASNEYIGYHGTGTFNQSGGTHTVTNNLLVGEYSGSTGTINQSAGSLSAGYEYIGYRGTGTFNQSGGSNTVSGWMSIATNAGSAGTYNLTGGTLTVGNGITNNVNGTFNVGAGATANFGGPGLVNHGLLKGGGTIAGNVTSDGIVGPGNSPGMLSITGNYTQSALGTYDVQIGGLTAGTQYDVLNVSGTAFLDGILNVSLFDLGSGLFAPHAGDTFDILTADILQGYFSSLSYAALSDPSLLWHIDYLTDFIGTTDVVRLSIAQAYTPVTDPPVIYPPVTSVPEPETYTMLLAGLGLIGFTARRRKNPGRVI